MGRGSRGVVPSRHAAFRWPHTRSHRLAGQQAIPYCTGGICHRKRLIAGVPAGMEGSAGKKPAMGPLLKHRPPAPRLDRAFAHAIEPYGSDPTFQRILPARRPNPGPPAGTAKTEKTGPGSAVIRKPRFLSNRLNRATCSGCVEGGIAGALPGQLHSRYGMLVESTNLMVWNFVSFGPLR